MSQVFLLESLAVTDIFQITKIDTYECEDFLHKRLTNSTAYYISAVNTIETVDSRDEVLLVLALL